MAGAGGGPGTPGGAQEDRERRLAELREEARRTGTVSARGVDVEGGPLPAGARPAQAPEEPGYYGQPVVKAPVWTWEIPTYFFVGGLAGMSGVIAAAARFIAGDVAVAVAALWIAAVGSLVSALLLISDLGRSSRFLNMLRVFKRRSPMSVGAWTLALFGGSSVIALVLASAQRHLLATGGGSGALAVLVTMSSLTTAVLGSVLGTYTGVLIGATAIPAWHRHRILLPAHFGIAGLGSSAALLQLLGFHRPALLAIALAASGAECLIGTTVELVRHGDADRALRTGGSGALLRLGGLLAGPAAFVLWLIGIIPVGAVAFLLGALVSRFGWLAAGRASARDPRATFAAQRG
jgi:hypothetical protein